MRQVLPTGAGGQAQLISGPFTRMKRLDIFWIVPHKPFGTIHEVETALLWDLTPVGAIADEGVKRTLWSLQGIVSDGPATTSKESD